MRKTNLNKLIDTILHPHFKKHPELIIFDGFLHALIEQDLKQSIRKFIKYNYPKIMDKIKNNNKT